MDSSDENCTKDIVFYSLKDRILEKIEDCEVCKAKMVFGHLPDYRSLIIQENARCLECGYTRKKFLFFIN